MNVRDQTRAVRNMQPRQTPEDLQTEGPPYNATTEIARRRETHPGALKPFTDDYPAENAVVSFP
jgi:hypothetical protein